MITYTPAESGIHNINSHEMVSMIPTVYNILYPQYLSPHQSQSSLTRANNTRDDPHEAEK